MQWSPLLPSLPVSLWPGVVAPDRVLSIGQIELNSNQAKHNCLKFAEFFFSFICVNKKIYTYTKLNRLKVFKMT